MIAEWDLDHHESPLIACLRSLCQQDTTYRSPSIRHLLDTETPQLSEALTPREQTVLSLILSGQSNQEI
ncbi:MAG: LuxR C-terminal-related transcriptional regulator, partial [Vulcanococcus sp.]